jgi:SM-20-related protein
VKARLLARLGVLAIPDFLDPEECARLAAEMRAAPRTEAPLRVRGMGDEIVDGRRRRTARVEVSRATQASVLARLLALKPRIERFFGMAVADVMEVPKFLVYRPGDFFEPHRDVPAPGDETGSPLIAARRVNMVVCLNDETDGVDGGGYRGGGLTLYGLIEAPRWRTYGFPVPAPTGGLVAFRADVLHEVAPIAKGERLSIVGRMLDPGFRP